MSSIISVNSFLPQLPWFWSTFGIFHRQIPQDQVPFSIGKFLRIRFRTICYSIYRCKCWSDIVLSSVGTDCFFFYFECCLQCMPSTRVFTGKECRGIGCNAFAFALREQQNLASLFQQTLFAKHLNSNEAIVNCMYLFIC